jgi:hypothetical protein
MFMTSQALEVCYNMHLCLLIPWSLLALYIYTREDEPGDQGQNVKLELSNSLQTNRVCEREQAILLGVWLEVQIVNRLGLLSTYDQQYQTSLSTLEKKTPENHDHLFSIFINREDNPS